MAIVCTAVRLAAAVFAHFGVYVPLELTALLGLMSYSVVLVGARGTTLGKMACGLKICSEDGTVVGWGRVAFRETLCKLLSAMPLLLGFLWTALTRSKRGWHDFMAGTCVVRDPTSISHSRRVVSLVILVDVVLFGIWAYKPSAIAMDIRGMQVGANLKARYADRDPASLTDVQSLTSGDRAGFASWLAEHGKAPADFVVQIASKHQVTIIGEQHHLQDNLRFLGSIIPDLYHRAGVSCIALEVCTAEDNARLAKLVTADNFDSKLEMDIARSNGSKTWGDIEYWNVLETVWRLNRTLGSGQKRMRVIGIDSQWDGPSFDLMGIGDEAAGGPLWEKLRFIRLLDDLVFVVKRDEIMARNVERRSSTRANEESSGWASVTTPSTTASPFTWRDSP